MQGGGLKWLIQLVLNPSSIKKAKDEAQRGLADGTNPTKAKTNLKGVEEGFEAVGRKAKKAGKDAQDALSGSQGVSGGVSSLTGSMKALGGAIVAAFAIDRVIAFGKAMFESASNAGETASKFGTTFGSAATEVDKFVTSYANLAGQTNTELRGHIATVGAITQGMGLARSESAKFSEDIVRLAGDLQSFNNVPFEQTVHALTSALTGEREALKTLGIVISEQDVQTRALIQTKKKNADALTQEEKAVATLALAVEKAGVANGDLERTKDSLANRTRTLVARFGEMKEKLALELMPTFEKYVGELTTWMDKNSESAQETIKDLGEVLRLLIDLGVWAGKVITVTVNVVRTGWDWAHKPDQWFESARWGIRRQFVDSEKPMSREEAENTASRMNLSYEEYKERYLDPNNVVVRTEGTNSRGDENINPVEQRMRTPQQVASDAADRSAAETRAAQEKAERDREKALEAEKAAEAEARRRKKEAETKARQEAERARREAENQAERVRDAQEQGRRQGRYGQEGLYIYNNEERSYLEEIAKDPAAFVKKAQEQGLDLINDNVRDIVNEILSAPADQLANTLEVVKAQASSALAQYDPSLQVGVDRENEEAQRREKAEREDREKKERDRAEKEKIAEIIDTAKWSLDTPLGDISISLEQIGQLAGEVASGLEASFSDAFSLLFEDMSNFGEATEVLFRGIGATFVGSIASYARMKVQENIASAIEEVAKGIGAAGTPAAGKHFASAAKHGAASVAWAALAGAAGAGAGAISGGGAAGAGVAGGSRNVGADAAKDTEKPSTIINNYVYGFDPHNPQHQDRLMQGWENGAQRHGVQVNNYPQ